MSSGDQDSYLDLTFHQDSKFVESHGRKQRISLDPIDSVNTIRIKQHAFGIQFADAQTARTWRESLVAPYRNLFSHKSGKRTVWIHRTFLASELDEALTMKPREGLPSVIQRDRGTAQVTRKEREGHGLERRDSLKSGGGP